jgi:LacI family transcriptional regulator
MTAREVEGPAVAERVTIADVARVAEVSPTTVSHVLSGKRRVRGSTSQRVMDAITELGYRPNSAAQQLRTRRSRMIAVLVPDITNPFYSTLTRGLADTVAGDDYGTFVCNTDGSLQREQKFMHDVLDRGVDGIVMASVNPAAQGGLTRTRFGTPIVCIGETIDDDEVDLVTAENEVGARVAAAHLLHQGAQRLAMIQGPEEAGTSRDRGFCDALAASGRSVDPALMVRGDWTRAGGRAAMHELMELDPRPDAVFCANDLTAIGAMDALRELGLRTPDDVKLAGFDDVDAATIVTPTLTTVRNPAYETGAQAGGLLLSRMLGQYDGAGRTVVLSCPLVVRDSG